MHFAGWDRSKVQWTIQEYERWMDDYIDKRIEELGYAYRMCMSLQDQTKACAELYDLQRLKDSRSQSPQTE